MRGCGSIAAYASTPAQMFLSALTALTLAKTYAIVTYNLFRSGMRIVPASTAKDFARVARGM